MNGFSDRGSIPLASTRFKLWEWLYIVIPMISDSAYMQSVPYLFFIKNQAFQKPIGQAPVGSIFLFEKSSAVLTASVIFALASSSIWQ